MPVRKQSVTANPMEAVRQNVKQQAADEFTRLERHDLPGATAIRAAEADAIPIHIQQPIVGDRDTMRVARKIGQDARPRALADLRAGGSRHQAAEPAAAESPRRGPAAPAS